MVLCVPSLAQAQTSGASARDDLARVGKGRYDHCLEVAARTPSEGFAMGLRWSDEGGGLPARHCMALALANDGRYDAAAIELESAAENLRAGSGIGAATPIDRADPELLADLYAQAGNAWLLAEKPLKAYEAFSQGLVEIPAMSEHAMELRVDRARASAMAGDYDLSIEDLNVAYSAAPTRMDILLYRASAYRALDNIDAAWVDIEQALRLQPGQPDALLERGNLNLLQGRTDAARADWLAVATHYPESKAAVAARLNIEQMDMLVEDPSEP